MKAKRLLFCIVLFVLSFTIARAQTVSISGTIYDDANGLTDNAVNGIPLAYVYAHVFDPVTGIVIATVSIPATSTYSFTGLTPNTTYGVAVSIQKPIVGNPRPSNLENLISKVYTGEGVATQGDGVPDGVTYVSLGTQDLSGVNFGIDSLPRAYIVSSAQINPGSTNQAQVPTLIGDDPEDGLYNGISGTNTVMINSLPTTGILYYKGVPVVAGDIIHNYIPAQLTLDPPNGNVTVKFTYRTVDAAGQLSDQQFDPMGVYSKYDAPAEVTMSFSAPPPTISGRVFHDANGLSDNTVNGQPSNSTEGQFPQGAIYIRIYSPCRGGLCYQQQAVAADGTYSIQVLANTTYSVRITDNFTCNQYCGLYGARTVGEHIGNGPGSDSTADGQIQVAVSADPVAEVNFGFEYQPVANDITIASQPNPLGTTKVQVPTLTGSDPDDGLYNGISGTNTVKIYPVVNDNYVVGYGPVYGILYYDGIPVTNGQVITNYNPAKLTLDPKDGNVTVKFQYRQIDAAGVESYFPATVTMPFSDTVSQLDFGDASDTYSTSLFNNGPRHTIVDGLRIGTLVDAEGSGQFNGNQFDESATGDNVNGLNDEDGIASFPTLSARQTAYSVAVAITNTTGADATLSGWIDFNRDQTFSNSERTQMIVPTGATSVTLTWANIPWSGGQFGLVGGSFARFRLASVASEVDNPTDQAFSGEVEDYALTIQ